MARRHRLECVINLTLVTRADTTIEHDLSVPVRNVTVWDHVGRNDRLANGKKVGTQAADEPLDKDLEDCCSDEGVEEANGAIVDVPE